MKKGIFTILAIMLFIGGSYAQSGFNTGNLRAGAGLNYASEISTVGLTFAGVYEVTPEWEASIQFTHFFENNFVKWSVFDFDGHYVFHQASENLSLYGLAGLAITRFSISIPEQSYMGMVIPGSTYSDSNLGLNLGLGANLGLTEVLNLAPELRYTVREGGYLRVGATLQYMF